MIETSRKELIYCVTNPDTYIQRFASTPALKGGNDDEFISLEVVKLCVNLDRDVRSWVFESFVTHEVNSTTMRYPYCQF